MSETPTPDPAHDLLLHGDGELRFRTILVPVDFSIGTATQVRVARELARSGSGSLCLLHVRDPLLDPGGSLEASLNGADFDLMLEAMKLDLTRSGFHVESSCVRGSPGAEIVQAAKARKADVIVMGTHGRTGLKHVLMGSVAEYVVRRAPCPVLTLRLSEVAHLSASAADRDDERARPASKRTGPR